MLYLTTIKN